MDQDKRFIKLMRGNKCLLRIKLKEESKKYNSNKGEVDIMIDAAKNFFFDHACLQTENGRVFCERAINSASWHGFYDERSEKVKSPVINFKNNHDKIWCPRHKGVIQQKDIFLFPICSNS